MTDLISPLPPPPERRIEQLRRLTEISRLLTYTRELDEVLRLGAERAAALLGAPRSALILADEHGVFHVRAAHGVDAQALAGFEEPTDETIRQRLERLIGPVESGCFLGVPLVTSGVVSGVLAVARRDTEPCSEEEEWLLSAVADQVAVAVENARLESDLRRELEGRARARVVAEEASDRALATLSHDLRSPLNAIDSYSELMEMELFGPVTDRQREALGRIRMSGRHLLAVLENVLEMTRLSAGVVRIHRASVAAAAVVEEAALMVRPSAAAKLQTLEVEADRALVLEADPDRLRQVLVNLIGNAVKYTPERGAVRVVASAMERDGRRWGTIAVIDTGPGIAPEMLQAIFRPYYRAPGSESAAPDGIGLGLAISRELARKMGGEIEVESEPGSGSTFTVRLPLPAESHPAR